MPMYCFDLNAPVNLKLNEILCDEFVFFRLPDSLEPGADESIHTIIEALSKKTSRLFFSGSNVLNSESLNLLDNKFDIRWFGHKIEVGDVSRSLQAFSVAANNLNVHHKCIPEFSVAENYLQLPETIITFFKTYDLPFAFISVSGAPDSERVKKFKDIFVTLRKNGFRKKLYFSFNNRHLDEWNIKTLNTFSGLNTVHIDLSNKCTHSCVFCGIWGPEFIEEMKSRSSGVLSEEMISFMNRQIPHARALEILDSLPDTVKKVQFGGAGDPLTHPEWFDIISRWRSRGFDVEVLTNFEYPTDKEIEALHLLARGQRNFSFLINVSAATAETYKAVRPRQSKAVFEKVIENIKLAHELRLRDGCGLSLTILNIINNQNYKEAVKMVELAHELGVGVWLKPLEIHSPIHNQYTIPAEEKTFFAEIMAKAAKRAEELKVEISFKDQLTREEVHTGDLYNEIPCTIGFTYARFEVDGTLRPCCITNTSMGNIFQTKMEDVWHSDNYYRWREKFLKINETRFHHTDSEYSYCKMCPHIPLNQNASSLLKIERD